MFQVEEIPGVLPGSLSRYLGYLPTNATRAAPTLDEFLATTPICQHRKQLIRELIAELDVEMAGERGGARLPRT